MDSKEVIKEFKGYVGSFVECCESDRYMHQLLESVLDVIEEQEERIAIMSEGGWISVEERLPKSMANKVLVWLEHDDLIGQIAYGHYEKYDGEETWYDLEHLEPFSDRGYRVTHWMESPEPPKEGEA